MQYLSLVLALVAVASAASGDRGSYTVPGLGSRKQAILNAGGNSLDLAIAMLETERMSTDYTYGMFIHVVMLNLGLVYAPAEKKTGRTCQLVPTTITAQRFSEPAHLKSIADPELKVMGKLKMRPTLDSLSRIGVCFAYALLVLASPARIKANGTTVPD